MRSSRAKVNHLTEHLIISEAQNLSINHFYVTQFRPLLDFEALEFGERFGRDPDLHLLLLFLLRPGFCSNSGLLYSLKSIMTFDLFVIFMASLPILYFVPQCLVAAGLPHVSAHLVDMITSRLRPAKHFARASKLVHRIF